MRAESIRKERIIERVCYFSVIALVVGVGLLEILMIS